MHMSPLKLLFFTSLLPKKIFSISFLTLLITSHFISYSIFIDVACYNHCRVFYACCTISMYITIILAVMLRPRLTVPELRRLSRPNTCWAFNLRIFFPYGLNNSQIPLITKINLCSPEYFEGHPRY